MEDAVKHHQLAVTTQPLNAAVQANGIIAQELPRTHLKVKPGKPDRRR